MSKKAKPLTPPDLKRCQGEFTTYNPWVMGGQTTARGRCESPPTWIAKETKPGSDGQKGSMALCDSCKEVCAEQVPDIAFKTIKSSS